MNPFLAFIADIRAGQAVEDYTEQLRELVEECRETGRAGTITLKVTIKPFGKDESAMRIEDSLTIKPPKPDTLSSVFFAHGDGRLTRRDPRQPDLPHLATATDDAETVDPETGEIIAS